MTKPNEQCAYFTIIGEFDPRDISTRVGVEPTESWAKGDVNPRTLYERNCSRWSLFSRLEKSCELESHIADVLDQMNANKSDFLAVSSQYGGHMQFVAYFNSSYPGLHFERGLIESLSEYGLSVDSTFTTFTQTAGKIRKKPHQLL